MPRRFCWTEWNTGHIARHNVETFEAEEAMTDVSQVVFYAQGKEKMGVIGRTEEGRFLVVIFTIKDDMFFVITARDAEPAEKRSYKKK